MRTTTETDRIGRDETVMGSITAGTRKDHADTSTAMRISVASTDRGAHARGRATGWRRQHEDDTNLHDIATGPEAEQDQDLDTDLQSTGRRTTAQNGHDKSGDQNQIPTRIRLKPLWALFHPLLRP